VVKNPLIHLARFASHRYVWVPALLITVYGLGTTATAFVLPDYLTRVQGLRALQIGEVLNWIALPQFVLVPLTAWLLRWVDARMMHRPRLRGLSPPVSWMDASLTHDWANADFLPSQIVEAASASRSPSPRW
jgi:DHA2 family multidrug resistance protein